MNLFLKVQFTGFIFLSAAFADSTLNICDRNGSVVERVLQALSFNAPKATCNNVSAEEMAKKVNLIEITNIYHVDSSDFEGLASLSRLLVQFSGKEVILRDSTFGKIPSLVTLDLDYNDFYRIEVGVFDELTSLKTLLLRNTGNAYVLRANLFRNLSQLESLYLDNSSVVIEPESFKGLNSLTKLSMRHTRLGVNGGYDSTYSRVYLTKAAMAGLSNLRIIDFSHTHPVSNAHLPPFYFENKVFGNLPKLEKIDLTNFGLETVSRSNLGISKNVDVFGVTVID